VSDAYIILVLISEGKGPLRRKT